MHRNRRQYHSRLATLERKRAARTIAVSILAIGFIGMAILFYGIPLLIRMSSFISTFNPPADAVDTMQTAPITSPVLNALPESTSETQIAVSGFTNPKTPVSIFVNFTEQKTTLSKEDGSFETKIDLDKGENEIYAVAGDKNRDKSAPSKTWLVVQDNTEPTIEITTPANNASYQGNSQKLLKLEGKTEPNSHLTLNTRLVIIQSDGSFTISIDLHEGPNELIFLSTDKAGNSTEQKLTISWSP